MFFLPNFITRIHFPLNKAIKVTTKLIFVVFVLLLSFISYVNKLHFYVQIQQQNIRGKIRKWKDDEDE